jgi:hypothetical protein
VVANETFPGVRDTGTPRKRSRNVAEAIRSARRASTGSGRKSIDTVGIESADAGWTIDPIAAESGE